MGNQNNFISVSTSSDKYEWPDYGIFSLMAHVECHLQYIKNVPVLPGF